MKPRAGPKLLPTLTPKSPCPEPRAHRCSMAALRLPAPCPSGASWARRPVLAPAEGPATLGKVSSLRWLSPYSLPVNLNASWLVLQLWLNPGGSSRVARSLPPACTSRSELHHTACKAIASLRGFASSPAKVAKPAPFPVSEGGDEMQTCA